MTDRPGRITPLPVHTLVAALRKRRAGTKGGKATRRLPFAAAAGLVLAMLVAATGLADSGKKRDPKRDVNKPTAPFRAKDVDFTRVTWGHGKGGTLKHKVKVRGNVSDPRKGSAAAAARPRIFPTMFIGTDRDRDPEFSANMTNIGPQLFNLETGQRSAFVMKKVRKNTLLFAFKEDQLASAKTAATAKRGGYAFRFCFFKPLSAKQRNISPFAADAPGELINWFDGTKIVQARFLGLVVDDRVAAPPLRDQCPPS